MRIDKFLWCVRLSPTRSAATEQCRRGHVELNGLVVKPAHEVVVGDEFAVRRPPIWRRYVIIGIPASRVGARLVGASIEERTPFEDLEKAEIARKVRAEQRDPGSGRPTKRERRDMDRFTGG